MNHNYAYYDTEENVIAISLNNVTLSKQLLDELLENVQKIASQLPTKVHAVFLWKNVKIPDGVNDYVGEAMAKLLKEVHSVERYETNDSTPFQVIKTGSQASVFSKRPKSWAAALANIRLKEEAEKGH